ncbi:MULTISPECIES: 3-oxoacyl-ACP synthase [unclassified Lysinibacillus]|uniref:3-oxoacyl-ACP synthase n=1 Tax=unclassified Lysinibacillus TaxID=2636778 RepID=UPI0020129CCF|nr:MULTISPECIES: 3-oxoacyl-ACP synthase [unclassified Lysinibacillus]MCL1697002.1 3-oxoacyl-ACP synthase [Lysinibacillus sp. BPa_S21]MCL1701723.1 3-oxoacyl-ACP synthase [Lysinibacillus sp. Bpr_S20]
MTVGIVSTGLYIPNTKMTSKEIAALSNIPEDIIRQKMGIYEKPIPGEHDHTVQMGIWAAQDALRKSNVDPKDIDIVIYMGEEHKEYPLWTASIKMQEELGAVNAWAFDVQLRCGTTIMALKLAKSLMASDESVHTVLLAGGYRNVDFIDYSNPRTRFMYNLAAGGGAILLQKDYDKNHLLEADIMTDGSFSEDVVVPVGGTKKPLTSADLENNLYQLDVIDPMGMKDRLEQKSLSNFLKVIRTSLAKSGLHEGDISYLAMLHMKKSAHDYILSELGLEQEQSIYLQNYGHIGQIDQIVSLQLALEEGRIHDGDIVTLVSAGIGYVWGAITIRWG